MTNYIRLDFNCGSIAKQLELYAYEEIDIPGCLDTWMRSPYIDIRSSKYRLELKWVKSSTFSKSTKYFYYTSEKKVIEGTISLGQTIDIPRCEFFFEYSKPTGLNTLSSDLMKQAKKSKNIELISSDGQTFTVSKKILTARSEVFTKMLSSGMQEQKTNTIKMNVSSDVLKEFVYFLEMDVIKNQDLQAKLAILGDMYQIPYLIKICQLGLIKNLNEENYEQFGQFAIKHRLPLLLKELIKFIAKNQ